MTAARQQRPRNNGANIVSKSKPLDRKEAIKRIDNFIAEHNDWRGETLARIREIIHEVAPDVIEDWKYMGSPFGRRTAS